MRAESYVPVISRAGVDVIRVVLVVDAAADRGAVVDGALGADGSQAGVLAGGEDRVELLEDADADAAGVLHVRQVDEVRPAGLGGGAELDDGGGGAARRQDQRGRRAVLVLGWQCWGLERSGVCLGYLIG